MAAGSTGKLEFAKYEFRGFWIDIAGRRLHSTDGPVELSARAFDVLLFLVEHRGEDVDKERLMSAAWPNSVVEDNNLNQAITALRRALQDQRNEPQFIMTVPGRGYRFIAKVVAKSTEPVDSEETAALPERPESRNQSRWSGKATLIGVLASAAVIGLSLVGWNRWNAATVVAPVESQVDSLAVLPFRPLLAEQSNPALELGMVDALIGQISRLPGMIVRPLSTVAEYTSATQDPIEIGRKLGVAAVLEGTVQKQDGRIRVSSRLLRVSDGRSLWSERFDEPMSGIFEVQDAISNRVMNTLGGQLGLQTLQPADHPTVNAEAYQLYASGTFNRIRRDIDGTADAVRDFKAAIEEDPNYALAWASLATVYCARSAFGIEPASVALPKAKEAAAMALKLDSKLAESQGAMGQVLVQYERKFLEGERYYERARQLNPNYGTVYLWSSINYLYLGRTEEGLAAARRAQELEPTNLAFSLHMARALYLTRNYDAAIAHTERLLTMVPTFADAHTILGRALLHTHKPEAALAHFAKRTSASPGSFGDVGRAYAIAGKRAEALAEIDSLSKKAKEGYGMSYDIAGIYALLGDFVPACAALKKSLTDLSQLLANLRIDPDFDTMRDQKCVAEVEKKLYSL